MPQVNQYGRAIGRIFRLLVVTPPSGTDGQMVEGGRPPFRDRQRMVRFAGCPPLTVTVLPTVVDVNGPRTKWSE